MKERCDFAWNEAIQAMTAFKEAADTKLTDKPLDEFHWHEAFDRTEMIRELVENSLQSHRVIVEHQELARLAEKIQDALAMLYQEIGKEQATWEE